MSTKNSDYTQLRIRKSTNAKLTGETMISVVDLLVTAELERYEYVSQADKRSGLRMMTDIETVRSGRHVVQKM